MRTAQGHSPGLVTSPAPDSKRDCLAWWYTLGRGGRYSQFKQLSVLLSAYLKSWSSYPALCHNTEGLLPRYLFSNIPGVPLSTRHPKVEVDDGCEVGSLADGEIRRHPRVPQGVAAGDEPRPGLQDVPGHRVAAQHLQGQAATPLSDVGPSHLAPGAAALPAGLPEVGDPPRLPATNAAFTALGQGVRVAAKCQG